VRCNDYGDRPGCLGEADDRYTMRFDDIGMPPLYWCAACGPQAHAINAALEKALTTRGPEFTTKLGEAIDAAEAAIRRASQ
jgi:20S proteasome alpha/beta subunit